MAKKQAINLSGFNITPSCIIQVMGENTLDNWEAPLKWMKLAETSYTPKHINDVLKKHNIDSAWVTWACGKELWFQGEQIASIAAAADRKPAKKKAK